METALILNCCSRWAKQCLIWNKCYAIDSDHAGAGSGWEKPSWEPSPGLEKSTPKLLGRSSLQGKHPRPWDLAVLSLKQHQNKTKKKWNFCEYVVVKVSFLSYFPFFGGWGWFNSTSLPCSSALAKNFLEELMGCYFCCFASLLLEMLNKTNLFLISSLPPWEGGDFFTPHASWQNPLQQHLQSCLWTLGISSACFTFNSRYYLCNYVVESQFLKKANPPRDDCLREFTLPDVNERVDFSRPGITHIKTIDISKCMDICTWH